MESVKECKNCGSPFEPTCHISKQKFCSNECRVKYNNAKRYFGGQTDNCGGSAVILAESSGGRNITEQIKRKIPPSGNAPIAGRIFAVTDGAAANIVVANAICSQCRKLIPKSYASGAVKSLRPLQAHPENIAALNVRLRQGISKTRAQKRGDALLITPPKNGRNCSKNPRGKRSVILNEGGVFFLYAALPVCIPDWMVCLELSGIS